MTTLKSVIVEDEELACELLKKNLQSIDYVELIGEFNNGFDAVKGINELKPDLLFLDIQVPKINGFEILELLDYTPVIIFTTAYNDYAIKAFEISAVDYLLKPYTKERLALAVDKAQHRVLNLEQEKESLTNLLKQDEELSGFLMRVVIKDRKTINVVPVGEIIWIEAQDDYVMIYTASGKYLKQKTLNYFDANLDSDTFIRVHRSAIVRIDQIVRLELYAKESYLLFLKNGDSVKVSKNRYKDLKKILNI